LPSNFFSEVSFNDRTNFFFTKKKSFSKNWFISRYIVDLKRIKTLENIHKTTTIFLYNNFLLFISTKNLCYAARHINKTVPDVMIKSFCDTTYVYSRATNNIYNYFTQHVWMWTVSKLSMTYCNRKVVNKTTLNMACSN
jgi:hypothetical protein